LKGVGYETSYVGVAVADKPNGPFIYHHKFHGGGSPKELLNYGTIAA
jgi:hypothetical protein